MNKLQLFQKLHRECGVSGATPTSTTSVTGELARLLMWLEDAWTEIQERRPNWDWMTRSFSFQTEANKYEYTALEIVPDGTLCNWRRGDDSLRSHLTSAGVGTQAFMGEYPYRDFRDYYLFGTRPSSQSQPLHFAVSPANSLLLGPNPNDIYTITGEYYCNPTELTSDASVPEMPDRFHKLIVYRAMQDYGYYEAAPEVLERGLRRYNAMMFSLESDQLPDIEVGGPLV